MLKIGSVIDGKYKILSQIDKGGMSVVYLALNERANKTWAIKEVRKDGVQDFTTVKRGLIAETDMLKKLNHKHLPSIVDVIDEEDTFLIVMDYVEGKCLNKVLKDRMDRTGKPIGIEEILSWGIQLCDVLQYLHTREKPIVYRDLKPSNVMLQPNGEITLIDFGTAREFKVENIEDTISLGTPGYAAPEQYGSQEREGKACPQSDIYCLGATLHHLVTGRNPAVTPFHFPLITQCRSTLLEETPRELRDKLLGLEMVLDRCTRQKPEQRYQNCVQLQYDLEHTEELGMPHRRKLKKKMQLFLASAGTAVALGTGSLIGAALAKNVETSGYEYYLENAKTAFAWDKFTCYKKAVALDPYREEAWLALADAAGEDNAFTTEEDSYILALLNSRDNGRNRDNKTLFQKNQAGYVRFAYRMGMLYYYTEGTGQNKASAGGWFDTVCKADLEQINLGEEEDRKTAWKTRAEILGKISGYYSRIGQINQAGDTQISYKDYWEDLVALTGDDIAGKDNVITELRLYREIVCQVCTNYDVFQKDGVEQKEMLQTLQRIKTAVQAEDTQENQVAEELKRNILEAVVVGKKQVQAMPVAGAGITFQTDSGSGEKE